MLGTVALSACTASSEAASPAISAQPTPQGTYRGLELDPPQPRPTFTLTDTAGKSYDFAAETRGVPTLLFFGYTHCPDVCPTTMAGTAAALRGTPEPLRSQVRVVFVTTDPARDTGPVIRHWLDHFSSSFIGVTGPLDTITKVATDVGVPIAKGRRLPSGGYDVTHGTQVLGVDGKNTVPVVWTLGTTAPEFAHDIHQLLN